MPLTEKGRKIKAAMVSQYGMKKGEQIFYSMQDDGKMQRMHGKMHKTMKGK